MRYTNRHFTYFTYLLHGSNRCHFTPCLRKTWTPDTFWHNLLPNTALIETTLHVENMNLILNRIKAFCDSYVHSRVPAEINYHSNPHICVSHEILCHTDIDRVRKKEKRRSRAMPRYLTQHGYKHYHSAS